MMEPSQVMGDEDEECCSSESGWTMYIASSPDHHDEVDDDDDENDKEKRDKTSNSDGDGDGDGDDDDDDDDDDSMTSDASSGHPTHLQLTCGSSKGSRMAQYKHAEKEPATKSPPDNRRVGRKRDEKTKIDMDQEWVLNSNSTESCGHVRSGAKVRKTH